MGAILVVNRARVGERSAGSGDVTILEETVRRRVNQMIDTGKDCCGVRAGMFGNEPIDR